MKKSKEQEILEFAEGQWGEKSNDKLVSKLFEEGGEIAGACVKIPEGRATNEDLDDELGDALIVLSQFAAKRGTTLEELRSRRFNKILKRPPGNKAAEVPDTGEQDRRDEEALRRAGETLGRANDIVVCWDHPGHLCVVYRGYDFAFGFANGPLGYDYNIPGEEEGDTRHGGDREIKGPITADVALDFLREEIERTVARHSKVWTAVPFLIYVRKGSDEETDIAKLHARINESLEEDGPEARAFVAEDFETATVFQSPARELSARLATTCERII